MSATTTTPPLPTIIWDDQLGPHNPVTLADWPIRFKSSGDDDSMPYDAGQTLAEEFLPEAWDAKPSENTVVGSFRQILEHHCPRGRAIHVGSSYTFHQLEKHATIDNMSSGSRETYGSACKRFTKGKKDAAAALGMDQPSSFHSSEVSVLDFDRAAFRSMSDKVAGQQLLDKLLRRPLVGDLFVRGSVYNRHPRPSRSFRSVLFVEAKPPTGSMRTHIADLIQALKYAVIGRDMHGTVHVLLVVGMAFRRIVCDRTNNDIYVDIGTKAGGEMIEVEEMSLIKLLWYGYVEGAPPQMPMTTAFAGPSTGQAPVPANANAAKSRGIGQVKALTKVKTKPFSRPPPSKAKKTQKPSPLADKLFYHLSKPDPPSPRPQSDTDARHALISFLDHMGQTHFDILRDVNETPESPLRGLTGRWAKIRDVKLEQLGSAAVTIQDCWSELPVGDTETASSQNLESNYASDDDGGDGGSNDDDDDDDDNGSEGKGEGGDNGEEDAGPGGEGRHNPTGPSSRDQGREDSSGDPRSSQDTIRGNQNRLASGTGVPPQLGPACPLQAIPEDSQLANVASLDAGDHPSDTSPTGSSSSGPRTLSSSTDLSLRTPQSLPIDGLRKIRTTSPSPEDRSRSQDGERYPSTGNDMFWDALGISAFQEKQNKEKEDRLARRRAWLEPYEPFTRARP